MELPPPLLVGHVVRQVSPVRQIVVAASEVVVAFVEVELPMVSNPMLPLVEKRFVEEAVVLKKLVVVAAVPVALINVKF